MRTHISCLVTTALTTAITVPVFGGGLPVSGRPTAGLSQFDTRMQDFMDTNGLEAGVLGVMRNGVIVYLKGFGYDYDGNNLPENAPFRLASCSKPITVAAVRQRIEAGDFTLNRRAYNLSGNNGLLNYSPFPSVGDSRLKDITIQHLISHLGGWDRSSAGDLTRRERDVADDMGVASPPGRVNTVRWILGQPLQYNPGGPVPNGADQYSNIGCLTMGLIVEQETGQSLLSYVRNNVLTPGMWVPSTNLFQARTFRANQNAREPEYAGEGNVTSVFDSFPGLVNNAYGGFDAEARIGQGGYCCTASTMLTFLQNYHCGAFNANIGQPINDDFPLTASESHNGGLPGINTMMVQRTDGINVFVAFNEDDHDSGENYASDFYNDQLDPLLDAGTLTWPGNACDGSWVTTSGVLPGGVGGYHAPYSSFSAAVLGSTDGTKLRLKAGVTTWTGTINKRLLIDAPLGAATIGQ